jgi:hypothetical protein
MVICSLMLLAIIVTLLALFCCYKNGFMWNKSDDDDDTHDSSGTRDADGNERQKAILRKIYKFNRPNDASAPSAAPTEVPTVLVSDKQTNTLSTIAKKRPADLERAVWTSVNAFGGKAYRPLVAPSTSNRLIQVVPRDFEVVIEPKKIVYEVIAPDKLVPSVPAQTRYVRMPAAQTSVIEVVERARAPVHTGHVRHASVERVIEPAEKHIEYVHVEQARTRAARQQTQYEIVEEVLGQSESTDVEEYVEIVDTSKHRRQTGKHRARKQTMGTVSVKHVKPIIE